MARAIDIKPYQPRKVWDKFIGPDGMHFRQGLYPANDLFDHLFLYPGDVLGRPYRFGLYPNTGVYPSAFFYPRTVEGVHRPGVYQGVIFPHSSYWFQLANTWFVQDGAARITHNLDYSALVIQSGISNIWLRLNIRLNFGLYPGSGIYPSTSFYPSAGSRGGICFRAKDEFNYWYAILNNITNQVELYERVGTVHNLRASAGFVVQPNAWHWLAVLACDEDIRIKVDEVMMLAFDSESYKYATHHGMFLESIASRIDEIIIEKAPPAFPR